MSLGGWFNAHMIFSDRAPITDSQNGMGAIKKSLGKLALMDYRKKWTIGKNGLSEKI